MRSAAIRNITLAFATPGSGVAGAYRPFAMLPAALKSHKSPRRPRHTVAASAETAPQEPSSAWRKLTVPDGYLRLSQTLPMGQAFRWHLNPAPQPTPETGASLPAASSSLTQEWAGCINETLYILRQADPEPPEGQPDPVYYMALPSGDEATSEQQHATIVDFFRADVDYTDLFAEFRRNDAVFDFIFPYFRGVRTIRHDPVECLFSYICSSNNHMKRIAAMVNHLGDTYGSYIATYRGRRYNAFPSVKELAEGVTVSNLREAGFGYRAGYVVSTAHALLQVAEQNGQSAEEMLLSWRKLSRREVEKNLIRFAGIGRKVAGCISMMSLDQLGEIPVDTHVWQMGSRYLPELKGKKLSKKTYDAIGACFRDKFGEETAGLAHNILFAAELDEFKDVIPGGAPAELWKKGIRKRKRNTSKKESKEEELFENDELEKRWTLEKDGETKRWKTAG